MSCDLPWLPVCLTNRDVTPRVSGLSAGRDGVEAIGFPPGLLIEQGGEAVADGIVVEVCVEAVLQSAGAGSRSFSGGSMRQCAGIADHGSEVSDTPPSEARGRRGDPSAPEKGGGASERRSVASSACANRWRRGLGLARRTEDRTEDGGNA